MTDQPDLNMAVLTGEGLPAVFGPILPPRMLADVMTPAAALPEVQRPSYLPIEQKPW